MIDKLKNWLKTRLGDEQSEPQHALPPARVPRAPMRKRSRKASPRPDPDFVDLDPQISGEIEDAGPGKNVLIRNKFVREDTGTHETLQILDDSMVQTGEETGIDPYNTGAFDRSRNWDSRFRK
ncbi:MAG: hypothetical protein K0U72_05055 [Gammaproteobacteria bacterium]|nr:hypothetical protein [Gammaproteobacteria bacterium]